MADNSAKLLWFETYSNKLIAGIGYQKNKVDNCLYWIFLINTAVVAGIIQAKGHEEKLALSLIGVLFTWMTMLRSALAYRQLRNFDRILWCLHNQLKNPNFQACFPCKEYLHVCVNDLDYSLSGCNTFILSERDTIYKHISWEYGPIYLIHILFILYYHNKYVNDIPARDVLAIVIILILVIVWPYFTIYRKKNSSLFEKTKKCEKNML